jgi:hypothetical protein
MEPTLTEFLKIFSEFDCLANAKVQFFYDTAKARVGEKNFCDEQNYKMAVYLMTAHTATILDPARAANGKISSEKAGDLSVSYDVGGGSSEELASTQYGLQYLRLMKENTIGIQVL